MIPIPERIHQIVAGTNGTKATFLCATLAVEYLSSTKIEIKNIIIAMVASGELVEVEYILPSYANESLLLPKFTKVTGWSNK